MAATGHEQVKVPAQPAPHKRGLSWPWDNTAPEFSLYHNAVAAHKMSWLFNWEMWKPAGFPSGIEYVPQVRTGDKASQIEQLLSQLHSPVGHFLGFNEPDMPSEANMTVGQAVDLWRRYVEPAKQKFHFRLGSPAITSDAKGKAWLAGFFKELGGSASCDFVAVHWYGSNFEEFKHFLEDMHNTFKKPLWVTEFAFSFLRTNPPAPTVAQVEAFIKEAVPFLDGCTYVERYAYYGAKTDVGPWVGSASNFSDKGHTLTGVGELYLKL